MFWVIILIIVLAVIACVRTYYHAELNELHKLRAGFEHRKHYLEEWIRNEHNGGEGCSIEELETEEEKGELEALDEVISEIDKEIESIQPITLSQFLHNTKKRHG